MSVLSTNANLAGRTTCLLGIQHQVDQHFLDFLLVYVERRNRLEICDQLPVFSANNPPLHDHETGQKSLPGAGLRADVGG